MKYGSFLVAFCLSASPAFAQDFVFWPDPVLDCLDDASASSMRQICIGTAANLCMIDNAGGFRTAGTTQCLNQERAWWDARLNDVYAQLLTQHAGQVDVQDNLRAMQRAWITYRDARCDYEFVQWDGGTGGGPALLACLMVATAEQTLVLEDQLQ